MNIDLYYTAPPQEQYEELKSCAVSIWNTYAGPDDHGYSVEKVNKIKDLQNVKDNFMYIIAMFDMDNQAKMASLLSPATRSAVNDRMIAGGQPDWANPFL